jgi:hypothetical protein
MKFKLTFHENKLIFLRHPSGPSFPANVKRLHGLGQGLKLADQAVHAAIILIILLSIPRRLPTISNVLPQNRASR